MPAKPKLDRPTRLELKLPETLRTRLDLYLFSDLEGRVPKGKYQEFFEERIRAFFSYAKLDLAPYGLPTSSVEGPKDSILELQTLLERFKNSKDG